MPPVPRPQPVAPDTWLVRAPVDPGTGTHLPLGSLVVAGDEPILVDTGGRDRAAWWAQVEAVVEPAAVRWVVVGHEAPAHSSGLDEVAERCPAATFVGARDLAPRLAERGVGVDRRWRWVGEGDVLPTGGRALRVVRPPAYDSPTALGLHDPLTGVYWASVCFGTPVPHEVDEVSGIDRDIWEAGFATYHRRLSPWLDDVDPARWRAAVSRVGVLGPRTIASARGPLLRRCDVGRALDMLVDLAGLPALTVPG